MENTTMTRQKALEAAAALMIGLDFGNAYLTAVETANWGKLAGIVLDMTGRTDLSDAIWEGR